MSGGIFSGRVGGPVSAALAAASSSSSSSRPSMATQARMSQFVKAKPMVATVANGGSKHTEEEAAPSSPVLGGDESMDAPTPNVDVPVTDPWKEMDATSPKKRRGIRKSAQAANNVSAVPMDQEAWPDSESDDNDFAPNVDSDSSDDAADDEDDDDDMAADGVDESGPANDATVNGDDDSDSDDDDDDEGMSPHSRNEAAMSRKHGAQPPSKNKRTANETTVVDKKPKSARRSKKEILLELQTKYFGRSAANDDDEEEEGESIGSDDDDDDDDDEDEADEFDNDGIVRDDASRITEALSFRKTVVKKQEDSRRALAVSGTNLDALMANYSKARDQAAFKRLMEGMAHAGFDVNSEPPTIPDEEFEKREAKKAAESEELGDDDDDEPAEEEPEESPIHQLIPKLVRALENDEIDLSEQLAKLCQWIFSRVLMICRADRSGASIDIGKDLSALWGSPTSPSQFYARCNTLIKNLANKTRTRFNNHLMVTFATAFDSLTLFVFMPCRFVINEAHDRNASPYQCASCAVEMTRYPLPDAVGLEYMPGVSLMQHKQVPIRRPTTTLHATSPAFSRPAGASDNSRQFLLCSRCAPIVPIMNQLLTAGHDIAYQARHWIEEHHDLVYSATSDPASAPQVLADAFHQDPSRQKLCQSIIWAYKIMYAVLLT